MARRMHKMRYLSRTPRKVPADVAAGGRVLVHNHIRPAEPLGLHGFRAWTQEPDDTLILCDCGWSGLEHYRVGTSRNPR